MLRYEKNWNLRKIFENESNWGNWKRHGVLIFLFWFHLLELWIKTPWASSRREESIDHTFWGSRWPPGPNWKTTFDPGFWERAPPSSHPWELGGLLRAISRAQRQPSPEVRIPHIGGIFWIGAWLKQETPVNISSFLPKRNSNKIGVGFHKLRSSWCLHMSPLSLIFQELIIQDRLQAQIKTDAQLVGETDIFQTHKETISWFVDLHGSQGGWNSSSLPRSSPWSRVGVTIGCTTKTFLISSYNFVAIYNPIIIH